MANAGTMEMEVIAHLDPALDTIELEAVRLNRHYNRRDRLVLWLAARLGVPIYIRRPLDD